MHPTTAAVRAMYERFPYPAGPVTLRHGFDVRRLRSCVQADRPEGRALHVLDAGCGRGAGLLGMAAAQPGVRFLGIDLNRIALDEVRMEARRRGITNVEVAEVDLETLAGLEVPEHGFDVIVSSGVVHHLVDPAAALARLTAVLAPWGALDLMVYAKPGRRGLERVASVIAAQVPDGPISERLAAARKLVAARKEAEFREASRQHDVEFVDRYLHPQFVSYELHELKALLESAGLAGRRWSDPTQLPTQPAGSDPWDGAREALAQHRPRMWSIVASHARAAARKRAIGPEAEASAWALNPEGTLHRPTRTLWTGGREGMVTWTPPVGPVLTFGDALEPVGAFLERARAPFRGRTFVQALARAGIGGPAARRLLAQLEDHDVLWRPHASDMAERAKILRAA